MAVTKSNESSQMSEGLRLSVEQLNAIDILVQGRTDQETAETVGVARETVTRWRNDNPSLHGGTQQAASPYMG